MRECAAVVGQFCENNNRHAHWHEQIEDRMKIDVLRGHKPRRRIGSIRSIISLWPIIDSFFSFQAKAIATVATSNQIARLQGADLASSRSLTPR